MWRKDGNIEVERQTTQKFLQNMTVWSLHKKTRLQWWNTPISICDMIQDSNEVHCSSYEWKHQNPLCWDTLLNRYCTRDIVSSRTACQGFVLIDNACWKRFVICVMLSPYKHRPQHSFHVPKHEAYLAQERRTWVVYFIKMQWLNFKDSTG